MTSLHSRVAQIAEATLVDQHFVTPIDVLIGLEWLLQARVDLWLRGLVTSLDRCIRVTDTETADAVEALRIWARQRNLTPCDTPYSGLTFTADGNPDTERHFRIRWAPSEDPAPKPPSLRYGEQGVLSAGYAGQCATCRDSSDLLVRNRAGGICPDCAGLGHLVYLPCGDAALTRHTNKAARASVAVMRVNVKRMAHERQGILTEQCAIELAAGQCLADPHRLRRKATVDERLRRKITDAIRAQFPGCPPARAAAIGYYAAVRGGRRAHPAIDGPDAVRLAVAESVRRIDTDHDDLYLSGVDHTECRRRVQGRLDGILDAWRSGVILLDG